MPRHLISTGSQSVSGDLSVIGGVSATGFMYGLSGAQFGTQTDNSTFRPDGTLYMTGSACVWDDLLPTLYAANTGGAAPNITLVGTSLILKAQEFANSSASEEYLPIWQFPHAWRVGSDVNAHIHLYIPDDVVGGNIVFTMTYTWNNMETVTPDTEHVVTGLINRPPNAGINPNARMSFTPNLSGAGKEISSIIVSKIARVQGGADTFGGTCWLLSSDIHIQKDSLGSREVAVK